MTRGWLIAVMAAAGLGSATAWAADDLATVNGRAITKQAFQSALESVPQHMQDRFSTPEGQQQLLDSLVTQEVLLQESERLGLDKDPAVQSRLAEAKREVLVETLMQKLVADEASDAKVKDYYNAHKADFRSVKASHILVATEDEAKAVKKRLKGGGEFAAVAKELSTDPSAKENGGDLGFFTKDQMVKPFADKAFAMKVNEISDPVKSEFGYHIIKVHEIKDAEPIEKLDPQALNGVKRAVLNSRVDKLKSAAKIVTNKEMLK